MDGGTVEGRKSFLKRYSSWSVVNLIGLERNSLSFPSNGWNKTSGYFYVCMNE